MSELNKCKADTGEKGSEFSNSRGFFFFFFHFFVVSVLLCHKMTFGEGGPVCLDGEENGGGGRRGETTNEKILARLEGLFYMWEP